MDHSEVGLEDCGSVRPLSCVLGRFLQRVRLPSLDQSELEWVGVVLSSRTLIAKFIHRVHGYREPVEHRGAGSRTCITSQIMKPTLKIGRNSDYASRRRVKAQLYASRRVFE